MVPCVAARSTRVKPAQSAAKFGVTPTSGALKLGKIPF